MQGPSAPGTGANQANRQCTLDVVHTTVTTVGNTVMVKPVIAFDAIFVGTMGMYGYAPDAGGLS